MTSVSNTLDNWKPSSHFTHLYQGMNQLSIRTLLPYTLTVARRCRITWWQLALPGILAVLASSAEGASCFLLLPTLNILAGYENEVYAKLTLRLPWLYKFVPDGKAPLATIFLAGIVSLMLLKILANYLSALITSRHVRTFTNELRSLLFEKILNFSKLYFDRISFGQQQEVLTSYVSAVALAMSTVQGVVYGLCCLVVYSVILLYLSPQLTLYVGVLLPVMWLATRWTVKKLCVTSNEHAHQYNELGRAISNSLANITLIKAYCAERTESSRFSHLCRRVASLEISLEKKALLIAPIQETCIVAMLAAVIVFVGLSSTGSKVLLAESLVFLVVLRRAAALFSIFGAARASFASASGPAREVASVLSAEDLDQVRSGDVQCPSPVVDVEFHNVHLSYRDRPAALQGLSLTIRTGETIGIVGASGAGKSSLVGILMKFYQPNYGEVRVNGVPLQEINTTSWLSRVAYVSQDAYLFHGTIRENLVFGITAVPDDDLLWRALEKVRLANLVLSLECGLDTLVGERGVQLSGGERQRVSLARAILKRAELWILDEPTSSLDGDTERQIQADLEEILDCATTIVIAHRLSTIKNADRILVIDSGKIVDNGTIRELLSRQGRFREEWKAQGLETSI